MSGSTGEQQRRLAAKNLIPEFQSIIRLCRGLTNTDPHSPGVPGMTGKVDQTIRKCSPVVHIITTGSTEKRKALATNWKTFTEEWPNHRYKISGDVVEHCLNLLQAIAEGA